MPSSSRLDAAMSHHAIDAGERIEEETAAAVVAEAVAIAAEAEASDRAAAVLEIAAAVADAADQAAQAAGRARDARTFAAKKAAESIARQAAKTAEEVQTRADAAALQVARAAAVAAEDLLAFGSQMGPGQVAVLTARTVSAAAEATAAETARAAELVAAAVEAAASQMVAVIATSDHAYQVEVDAAADALVGLTSAAAQRVALSNQQHADGVAIAARDAATALEPSATAARAEQTDSTMEQAGTEQAQGSPTRIHAGDRANNYVGFKGNLSALSELALGDGSGSMSGLLTSVAQFATAAIPGACDVGITWSEDGRDDVVATTSNRVAEAGRLDSTQAISVPLIVERSAVGSMRIYSDRPDGFDDRALEIAEDFAEAAAQFLRSAQVLFGSQRLFIELRNALKTRAVIDQAMGIVMSRNGNSPDEAFNVLRSVSQSQNRKLHLVAERLVGEAVRRAQARR